ncbi:hypothetical protein TRFO_03264 [Tritrichomonas foetus]|uniref:Uncharacterized protein n=1 Tax=Tritrichomonas foetus TaxID=1144522 RepID=A0A1J4KVJ0_9EUKA|nr:hypothetical protein TRFO_03264 [Tritrichomonas foetus]|eukprot:OHT13533.1 hypothetical protein TRFO_03264 [Tritrichomonas foetus]
MIDRIQSDATPELQNNRQEIIDDLTDISDFESFNYGECSALINSIHYNTNTGILYFYCYHFIPYTKNNKEVVNVQSMIARIQMKLAQPFQVIGKVKANFFRAKMSTEIRYLPPEGIQQNDIIQAIAIAFAPACLGLMDVPESFFTIMKTMAVQNVKDSDSSISDEQVSQFESMFDAAQKRQKGMLDDLYKQAKETFGIGSSSL